MLICAGWSRVSYRGGGGGGGGGALGFPPPQVKFPPPPPQKTEDNNIINLILNWLDMQQYKQWRIFLFSSLLTCCRYVATPGLASSARNIVHCLKPNCLGTRPRSSIPLCVRTYYVCERNLSKEEAHGGPGRPGTCNPRTSGTCSAKREGATRAHPEK